jgi:phosphonate transport system substrate-binding protein
MNRTDHKYLCAVSYLAPNLFGFYEAISTAVAQALGTEAELIEGALDPLEDPALLNDEIDLAFICGLPYTLISRAQPDQLAILAGPVMASARYEERPAYFADVIVNASSSMRTFEDLAQATFCYNGLTSNSGYNLLRGWMIEQGYTNGFFGSVVESGSHQRSIRWVTEGRADCSAVDSTVLEQAILMEPGLAGQLRTVASIGPSPMPPIVASRRSGEPALEQMRAALLNPDEALLDAMARVEVRRFAQMQPEDYLVLRQMWDQASAQGFAVIR